MPPENDALPCLKAFRRHKSVDLSPEVELERLTKLAARLFDVPFALINLIEDGKVWYVATHGLPYGSVHDHDLPCLHVVRSRQALMIADMTGDERTHQHTLVTELNLRFYASAPLLTAEGVSLGTLCLLAPQPRTLSAMERALLGELAAVVVDTLTSRSLILELEEAKAHINTLAYHDHLTGLPNRAFLMQHLEITCAYAKRHGSAFAVMLLDLDRFKAVNDSLGHAAGDQLLRVIAERLRRHVRAEDVVARFAGDEFVLVFPGLHDPLHAEHVAQALLDALAAPLTLDHTELNVHCSAGISFYPEDGTDTDALLRAADIAMYEAKLAGRGRYRTYNDNMRQQARERLLLKQLLDGADFRLHYQPLVSLDTARVIGVEAFLRWPQPDGTWIAPNAFLPLAEENDAINRIGRWVLREASAQLQAWRASGQVDPSVFVSVNLSDRHWRRADLPAQVRQLLDETGLPPECLVLELPEGTLAGDEESARATTQALRALGVRVALDGFGAGYSNLSRIGTIQLGQLKMDHVFVAPLDGVKNEATLAHAVIALGRGLNIPVVAKGVETEAQCNALKALGCDIGQGFWFGEPAPAQACAFLAPAQDSSSEGVAL